MFRSGLLGFTLHGSLSHYYYQFCEVNNLVVLYLLLLLFLLITCETTHLKSKQIVLVQVLFPFHDWWVVPAKVIFDQTLWSAVWNSIYYTLLGFLRFESPVTVFKELRATFWPMLTVRTLFSNLFVILLTVVVELAYPVSYHRWWSLMLVNEINEWILMKLGDQSL